MILREISHNQLEGKSTPMTAVSSIDDPAQFLNHLLGQSSPDLLRALLFTDTGRIHAQYVRRAPNSGLLSANHDIKGPGVNAVRRVLELIEGRIERTAILTPGGSSC